MLELKNITMVFRKGKSLTEAVSNVSLRIEEGETVVLMGESGSGKTTLGRIASFLIKPTRGEVIFNGKKVWSLNKREFRELRPKVQVVHQDPYASLNPVKSVYSILATGISLYKFLYPGDAETHIKELLREVGITPPDYFLFKYPHHLSGGMRQRLSFARALIPKPKLIVADECISMIDPTLKVAILDLIKRLNKEIGMAFLYITHEPGSASYLSADSRLLIMLLGRIIEVGTVKDILKEPYHPYTRALIELSPSLSFEKVRARGEFLSMMMSSKKEERPTTGCSFYPRCLWADDRCTASVPELRMFRGRWVACHRIEGIPLTVDRSGSLHR